MKRIIIIAAFIICMVFPGVTAHTQDILQKIDAYRILYEQFTLRLKITSYKNGKVREAAEFDVYIDGNDKSLVIAKKYRTKDMKILYVNENMWVQLPNTRRPIRITPIQRLMGEASNGDVARVSYAEDYSAERLGREEIDGIICEKLKLKAVKKSATYNKILLYVSENDYRPVKAEYFMISGKHYKTSFFEEYSILNNRPVLTKMTIYDELRRNSKTTFEYLNIEEKKLPSRYYNKNYMIHIKGL